jgi:rod shape-determining protein MreB
MFDSLFGFVSYDIGIDLGTANTMMLVVGKGVVVKEPSVVARNIRTDEVLAVGSEAKRMVGKTPATIEVVRPLKDGVIADYDAAEAMLRYYIRQIHQGGNIFMPRIPRPRVVVGVPSGITEVEARAVQDAALSAGARKAYLIEEPMATAIGAGLAVEEPKGRMVVDIGGGTTEIAIISLGGIVINRSIRTAGDELDEAIITFARMKYGLVIGQPTAEEVKIKIGSAFIKKPKKNTKSEPDRDEFFVVRGRDMGTGLPKTMKFSRTEVREALAPVVRQIITGVTETLEETPPELVSDILSDGITLAGGTGQLMGLDQLIAEHTKMSVTQVTDPQLSVVRGCAKTLENYKLLEMVKVVGGLR